MTGENFMIKNCFFQFSGKIQFELVSIFLLKPQTKTSFIYVSSFFFHDFARKFSVFFKKNLFHSQVLNDLFVQQTDVLYIVVIFTLAYMVTKRSLKHILYQNLLSYLYAELKDAEHFPVK